MTESEIKGLKSLHSKLNSIKNKIEEQHNKYLEKENKKYITFKGIECYTHEDVDDVYRYAGCTNSECEKAHIRLDKKKAAVETDKYSIQLKLINEFLSEISEEIRNGEFENQSDEEKRQYYRKLEEYLEEQEEARTE